MSYPSPGDVVQALMERSWDDDISDDGRILLEVAAVALQETLDRTVRLAAAIERLEVGL